jgi:hypothetical protein
MTEHLDAQEDMVDAAKMRSWYINAENAITNP